MQIKYFRLILITALLAIIGYSCGNSSDTKEHLPTDIVKNPRSASGEKASQAMPVIEFEHDVHDFGKVIQGEKVSYFFKFKNSGESNLILSNVSTSCGCTVPEFTRDPVAPGEEGSIKVTFDSDNRKGFQNKTVTVVSNTHPNTRVLRIKAQIVVPEQF
ncbi:MAG: DUF1573 domain-containing protein [Bacteroidales bacterium]